MIKISLRDASKVLKNSVEIYFAIETLSIGKLRQIPCIKLCFNKN